MAHRYSLDPPDFHDTPPLPKWRGASTLKEVMIFLEKLEKTYYPNDEGCFCIEIYSDGSGVIKGDNNEYVIDFSSPKDCIPRN